MRRLDKRKVIRFVTRLGLPCEHHGPDAPTWSGKAINLDVMDRGNTFTARWPRGGLWTKPPDLAASRILHEVGHALIVSPRRRRMPNYGLGRDNIGGYCKQIARGVDGRAEEAMATALTIALAAVLADADWAVNYLNATGFNSSTDGRARMWGAIAELQRRGLMDGHRPTAQALGQQARQRRKEAT